VNLNKRKTIFAILITLWVVSIALVLTQDMSLMRPVFPRPLPVYSIISMIITATILAGYSFKTGINILRSK
jgi:hypothetical protein